MKKILLPITLCSKYFKDCSEAEIPVTKNCESLVAKLFPVNVNTNAAV